ncbi:MAG: hydrogen gas-evolving membrane-bound hydrogenase subunit E [Synergistales bacterium]|nr:hydrogen gas-evolving membrane-bound hydrogenase subunit E [Synergistales bacterium]MDY6401689.1 hydrogen gas-evolving membrane-bound hydrogenase subunit E [Synergistales bacterium]MDY6404231.1 hydrogen gas-evolving membrane-bound hydrogenase subunit E [Synergistales bacterium]MDY6411229.1 hydrogen gas-evolving membrane-bound hydrogenase subunit E [Synergistales bacterium]MDY6415041.1 hydrogen gas-evolving membrane-bound hydrogenase subunit E [Synergistales bacterium]
MNEELKLIWKNFFNWVMGNGPRPENEVVPPEPPPDLPFTQKPKDKYSRFHEATLKERYDQWLEIHGLHIFSILYAGLSILTCVVIVVLLLATVSELPPFGDENNPANNVVIMRYVENGGDETGAQNIVAGLILDYRAFDTFGESAVLFTAAVSVLMLLGASRRNKKSKQKFLLRPHSLDEPILRGVASLSIPAILMMGCVVVINGHLSPGGGFSGGAILSTALILAANAYGFGRVHEFFNERTFIISSSTALMIYAVSKGYSFFTGANNLHSIIPKGTIGNILSAGLILPLNICVGLIVAGTLYAFYALFSEGDF